ncbi:MAG: alpha/beta fold hydrolase [Gemmatimonadaceae bacterium]|jgi:carboxylesterase|nr:alpha/beta fold hydrolase [Gemmatimonadaceae bacterium]
MGGAAAVCATVVVAAGVAAWAWRRSRMVRVLRFVAARARARRADGVLAGAEPIALDRSATHAVLLLHGFGDTPQSVAALATHLADGHGWTVRAPLLPGHGRTLADFAASDADQWLAHAVAAHDALTATHDHVAIVGLSMGGALATLVAARAGARCPALVLLAPYLTPPPAARRLARLAPAAQALVPWLAPARDGSPSIRDAEALAANLGYGTASPRLVRELVRIADRAVAAAPSVRAPVCLVHGTSDYRVPAALARTHPACFGGAARVELHWIDDTGHVLTVDRQRARVFALTAAWLGAVPGAPAPAPPGAGAPTPPAR